MNVAHVSPRYLPAQLRGGEQYLRILCEQQTKTNTTTLLTSNSLDFPAGNQGIPGNHYVKARVDRFEGVEVLRFPVVPLVSFGLDRASNKVRSIFVYCLSYEPLDLIRIFGWGPFTPSLYPYLTFSDYDFVHAAIWPTATLFLAFQACRRSRKPFIMTPFYHYLLDDFNRSNVFRRILPHCTAVVAATDTERKELVKAGADPNRTFVVPLSLDISSIPCGNRALFRQEHGLENKFVVLAHPCYNKGGAQVLTAVKQLSKQVPNLALVTFGEPDSKFQEALRSLSPFNFAVKNLNWIYGQQKWDTYAGSDVFAMPSIADAFGMTFLEAWAFGKPNLAAAHTCAEDIIKHGQDGFLVKNGDINDLMSKLKLLADNPELAVEMGLKGKERVKHEFTPAKMTGKFQDAVSESLRLGLPY